MHLLWTVFLADSDIMQPEALLTGHRITGEGPDSYSGQQVHNLNYSLESEAQKLQKRKNQCSTLLQHVEGEASAILWHTCHCSHVRNQHTLVIQTCDCPTPDDPL